ncbi:MAG: DUF922 domain-containing protein [Halioglobus sp.]
MNSLKTVLLAIATLLLVGCKVEIKVPEGGMVDGWTLHGCGEAQTCTIDVDHMKFSDLLTAIPNDTHHFVGWKRGDGYFCGGKTESCELSTFNFSGTALVDFLNDDEITFYLEPVFEPKYIGYQNKISPNIKINVKYTQVNYPIDGTDRNTWWEGSQSAANPIQAYADGVKAVGLAHWRSDRSSYRYEYSGGYCQMTGYEEDFYINVTLPSPEYPLGYESIEAQEYYGDIVFHEGAHTRIQRGMTDRRLKRINELFIRFRASSINACNTALSEKLVNITDETMEQARIEQEEFHNYNRKATWGECQESNRFMYSYCPEGM